MNGYFKLIYCFSVFDSQDLDGRQFISVLDLEDKALNQDLPPCPSPGAPDVPSVRPSSPTSAQLHVLATSVIRSTAAAEPQRLVTITEDLLNFTTHIGLYMSLYLRSNAVMLLY